MDRSRQLKIQMEEAIEQTDPGTPAGKMLSQNIRTRYAHFPELALNWGQKLLANDDDRKEALSFIHSAVANAGLDKKPEMILVGAARALQRKRLYESAEDILKKAVAKYPQDLYFKSQLGKLYLEMDKPEGTIEVLEKVRKIGRLDEISTTMLAKAYINVGEPEKSANLLRPMYQDGCIDKALANTYGIALIRSGRPKAALKVLKDLHESGYGDNVTIANLGRAYIHSGETQAAIDLLRPIYDDGEANQGICTALASAYLHDVRPKHAARVLRDLTEEREGNNIAIAMLANVLIHDRDSVGAMRLLAPMYNKGEKDPLIVGMLAKACVYAKNREAFDQVKDQIPNPMYRDYLEAHLLYAEYKPVSALEKLRPYIQHGDIATLPKNMVTM